MLSHPPKSFHGKGTDPVKRLTTPGTNSRLQALNRQGIGQIPQLGLSLEAIQRPRRQLRMRLQFLSTQPFSPDLGVMEIINRGSHIRRPHPIEESRPGNILQGMNHPGRLLGIAVMDNQKRLLQSSSQRPLDPAKFPPGDEAIRYQNIEMRIVAVPMAT
ncbi:hypothetical protein ES703_78825 [subsurface metagenome]